MTTPPPPPETSYRPDLPDWGVYLRWPTEGHAWIHPDDLETTMRLIPSRRVFRRSHWDGQHYWLHYGEQRLRVAPTMWSRVADLDLEVGQQVEVLGKHGKNDPGVFHIQDILYSPAQHEIEFYLRRGSMPLEHCFHRSDLRPIHVQYHLRAGYFAHQPPQSKPPDDLDTLDVGSIED